MKSVLYIIRIYIDSMLYKDKSMSIGFLRKVLIQIILDTHGSNILYQK